MITHATRGRLKCNFCDFTASRKDIIKRHTRRYHMFAKIIYECALCKEEFEEFETYIQHKKTHRATTDYELYQQALNGTCVRYRKIFSQDDRVTNMYDLEARERTELIQCMINYKVEQEAQNNNKTVTFKCAMVVAVEMERTENDVVEREVFYFRNSTAKEIDARYTPQKFLTYAFGELRALTDDYEQRGSGWRINGVEYVTLEMGKCKSLSGSCHAANIRVKYVSDLEKIIYKAKLVQEDSLMFPNGCFLYAVASYFTNSTSYCQLDEWICENLNVSITCPVKVRSISTFEEANKHLDFKVNVIYAANEFEIYPLRVRPLLQKAHVINLVLTTYVWDEMRVREPGGFMNPWNWDQNSLDDELVETDEKTEEDDEEHVSDLYRFSHYFLIQDLAAFLARPRADGKKRDKRMWCLNCLTAFSTAKQLDRHQTFCFKFTPQLVSVSQTREVAFESFNKKFLCDYTAYYDFESILVPCEGECLQCRESKHTCKHKKYAVNEQKPIAFHLVVVDCDGLLKFQYEYAGLDAADEFLDVLYMLEDEYFDDWFENKPMQITPAEQQSFHEAEVCNICESEFIDPDSKVRDHCHRTGRYLGACHNECNLNRKQRYRIPIFAHNSTNYDLHFVVSALRNDERLNRISAIPLNTEKFKTLSINRFLFLDSATFLSASLDTLAFNLSKVPGHEYKIMNQMDLYTNDDGSVDEEKKALLLMKQIYPYEYITSARVLFDKQLPKKEDFYSRLNDSSITDEEYAHAQLVFSKFECNNLLDYTLLYCKSDTGLLAEVMEHFRRGMFRDFKLDPMHYLSLPHFAFDAMLYMTKVRIELLRDLDWVLKIESNIRGGFSFASQRHVTDEEGDIFFVDVNGLYAKAMTDLLPLNDYKILTEEEWSQIDWTDLDPQSETGYFLEVDLSYPEHLHVSHNYFPLACENREITYDMLSPYAKEALGEKRNYKSKKLISSFLPRKNYVVHSRNLRFYLRHGLKLERIHSVLSFHQESFMKPFMDFCALKRSQSTNTFENNCFKLLANSCYGKMNEAVRKRMQCFFVKNEARAQRLIADPYFEAFVILSDDFATIYSKKKRIIFDKPILAAKALLDHSKLHNEEFLYDQAVSKFRNVKVIYGDTDSLTLTAVRFTEDISRNLSCVELLREVMDFSNYPSDHPLYNASTKNKLGLWKDELAGQHISEVVALRSKTYAIRIRDSSQSKCAMKGVKKHCRKTITIDDLKACLLDRKNYTVQQYHIRSRKHVISTNKVTKIAFGHFDDKRYLFECGIHSVPYGSCVIAQYDVCPYCQKLLF